MKRNMIFGISDDDMEANIFASKNMMNMMIMVKATKHILIILCRSKRR